MEIADVASEHRQRLESFETIDHVAPRVSSSPERDVASSGKKSNASNIAFRVFSPRRQTQPTLLSNLTLGSNPRMLQNQTEIQKTRYDAE